MNRQPIPHFPCISLVTICLNAEGTISETIASIRAQNYPNLEYIVIDGGSKDGTKKIINQNRDIITHYIQGKDEGPNHAFQLGIKKSTGDLFGLINADDWLEPGTLHAVAEKWRQKPEVHMWSVIPRIAEGARNTLFAPHALVPNIRNIAGGKVFPNARFYARTWLLSHLPIRYTLPDGNHSFGADMDLLLRLAATPFLSGLIENGGYTYRHHKDSLSINGNIQSHYKFARESQFILSRFWREYGSSLSLTDRLAVVQARLKNALQVSRLKRDVTQTQSPRG